MWQSDLHWAVEIATQILVVNERLLPQVGSLLFYSENWRKLETDRPFSDTMQTRYRPVTFDGCIS
jgi:hypothetical protein